MTPTRSILLRIALPAAALLAAAPAFAQTKDHAPVSLPSSTKMTQDKPGTENWTYAQPREVFTKYRSVIVEPTAVYQGPDAQFDNVESADRYRAATMITDELRRELAKTFPSPATPQADTLRLRVTILGATKTKGGIATATRVTPVGFGLSAVKSVLGKPGTFTGSILFAVELYDARTNELLLAAVRRRTPDPLDVPATISQEETVKAVAREFADGARKRLENLTGVQAPGN
jgi:hypothetical protein